MLKLMQEQSSAGDGNQKVEGAHRIIHETPIQLGTLGSGNNSQSSQAHKKVSRKLEFAIKWLQQHPESLLTPGRELEAKITLDGETISYKWWNEAKKRVS